VHYQRQLIFCGKDCRGCPHGPYWYGFEKRDGKTRSEYVGGSSTEDLYKRLGGKLPLADTVSPTVYVTRGRTRRKK